MPKDDFMPLLIIGGVGVAGYMLYQNGTLATWFPSLFGTASAAPTTPPAQPVSQTVPPATPQTPTAPSPGATLSNTSGGSASSFKVGDKWQITIQGPPNSSVSSVATFNGNVIGPTTMGTTDSTGKLVLTGSMAASSTGSWDEKWFVAGQQVGEFSFQVLAAGSSGIGDSFYGRHSRVPTRLVHGGPRMPMFRTR